MGIFNALFGGGSSSQPARTKIAYGTGLYHWTREKDSEGDKHNEMFVGYWNHGQQTNDGSQIHASDETKTWFKACSEGFRIAPMYGLRR